VRVERICARGQEQGFSLLEMVGVLSVLAILAAVTLPPVIQQIQRAKADAEERALAAIADALLAYVRDRHAVPGPRNWAQAVATHASLPAQRVLRNLQGFLRGYYIDPRFSAAASAAGYRQTKGLRAAPKFPRILLVSDLRADAPAELDQRSFDAVWNATPSSPFGSGSWVKVQRVHLGVLFRHLVLQNRHPKRAVRYRLDRNPPVSVAPQSVLDLYLLDGTRLALLDERGRPQLVWLAVEDGAFVYGTDGRRWYWGRP